MSISKSDVWSTIKSILPTVTIVIVLLSVVREVVFYAYFGIEINHYMEVSEILLMFADKLLIIALATFIVLAFLYFFFGFDFLKIFTADTTIKRFYSFVYYIYYILFGFIVILCISANYESEKGFYLFLSIILLAFFLFAQFQIKYSFIKKEYFLNNTASYLVIIFFGICGYLYFLIVDIQETTEYKYLGTTVTTKDSTHISDSTNYYIGRTNNYVFIHNVKRNSNTVIPQSEILLIEIKSQYTFFEK